MNPTLTQTPLYASPGPVTQPKPGESRAPAPKPNRQLPPNVIALESFPGFTDPRFGPAVNNFLEQCNTTPNTNMQLTIERMKRMVDGDHEIQADPTRLDGYVMVGRKPAGRVTLNYMGSDGEKFKSVLVNNMPKPKVAATEPDDLESVISAEVAGDTLRHWLLEEIDIDRELGKLAMTYWTGGTAYTYVHLKATDRLVDVYTPEVQAQTTDLADQASKSAGPVDFYAEAEIDPQAILDAMQAGPENPLDYDKDNVAPGDPALKLGRTNTDVQQVQELTVGLYTTDAREVTVPTRELTVDQLPWLRFDQEWFIGRIVQEYGDHARFLTNSRAYQDSGGEKLPSVQLNAHVLRLSTDDVTNRRDGYEVVTKIWVSPVTYFILKDEHTQLFQDNFPDGAVLHICRGRLLRISKGNIANDWVISSPSLEHRLVVKPIVTNIESGQVAVNTTVNYGIRTLHRNIPTTLVDSSLMSPAMIAAQRNNAYDVLRVNLNGRNLQNLMGNLPTANFPKEAVEFMGMIRSAMQELDNMLPTIFGMGAPASTYREGESRRMAALGPLMLTFKSVQRWMKCVSERCIKLKAAYGVQEIERKDKPPVVVHTDLKATGWRVEVAPELPVSDVEVADSLREVLGQNSPEVINALEILAPANRQRTYQLLKLDGYQSAASDIDAYCQMILLDLLKKPGQPDQQSGLMYPPVRPNLDIEDSQAIIGYLMNWIQKPDGGIITKRRNPEGFLNVARYLALYKAMIREQEMQQAMEQQQMGLPAVGPDGVPMAKGGGGGPAPAPPGPPEPGGRPPGPPPEQAMGPGPGQDMDGGEGQMVQ